MRHVLGTPGLAYFHTTYLFYPFGTTIANHPHTALPAFVAATLLKPLTVVEAQDVLLIGYVCANMAAMYALAWDITRQLPRRDARQASSSASRRISPSICSGTSISIAAFFLPLFALMVRVARWPRSHHRWAVGAGLDARGHRLHGLLLRRLPRRFFSWPSI